MSELELVDPTSPFLTGRFEPVHREIETSEVTVEGDLPAELVGAYVRNGPNPKFPPLGSYSYPMEGDGMLHGIWFEPDGVRYKNRWVQTQGLQAEERAGRALFGGVMTPAFVDQSLLGPDPDPGWPSKLDAFINIVRHNGRYLALEEGTPAYEVTPELETIGRFDFDGGLPKGLTAHPKLDPRTGELVTFRYDIEAPFLSWSVVGADGSMVQPETAVEGVDQGVMIHDFAITDRFLVLMLGPAIFDVDAMLAGGPLLAWRPELGTRIAVIARDGEPTAMDPPRHVLGLALRQRPRQRFDDRARLPGVEPTRLPHVGPLHLLVCARRLSPDAGTIEMTPVHDAIGDFPRMDERLIGRPQRYTVLTAVGSGTDLTPGEHDALCRVDLQTGEWAQFEPGGAIGETLFAPRPGGSDELDGWYLGLVTTFGERHSYLGVWDAADFPGPPRAKVHLPQRVPNGLHGNWFPAS